MGLFDRLFGKSKDKVQEIVEEEVASVLDSVEEEAWETNRDEPTEELEGVLPEQEVPVILEESPVEMIAESSETLSQEVLSELDFSEEELERETIQEPTEQTFEHAEEATGESTVSDRLESLSALAVAEGTEAEEGIENQASLASSSAIGLEKEPENQEMPSSLERAVAILRDKEKRAAAIKEAEERRLEEERLAQERAAQLSVENPIEETTQEKYERTLKKTRTGFGAKLNAFFANFRTVDEEFFEDLEELLITSDVGVQVATTLTEALRQEAKLENVKKGEDLRRVIIEKLVDIYEQDGNFDSEQINFQNGLTVMLFVGVNGVGKTTSIGKLANQYKNAGKKVMLVAADTFRAGAVAQLAEWGRRVDVPVVMGPEKSDPASVVYDGMEKAVAEGVDILMIDTAGRLQNKDNLMAELEKIGRIIQRVVPDAPHETLLALDASTGQNALVQAKEFSKITPLTGLVLTKIDGTARGGVVLAIRQELDIPVKLIGFGEKIDDIGQFNSEAFMRGLLEGLV